MRLPRTACTVTLPSCAVSYDLSWPGPSWQACMHHGERQAAVDALSIDHHRAGAALSLVAPVSPRYSRNASSNVTRGSRSRAWRRPLTVNRGPGAGHSTAPPSLPSSNCRSTSMLSSRYTTRQPSDSSGRTALGGAHGAEPRLIMAKLQPSVFNKVVALP
jgi:hypothetical protein